MAEYGTKTLVTCGHINDERSIYELTQHSVQHIDAVIAEIVQFARDTHRTGHTSCSTYDQFPEITLHVHNLY